MVCTAYFFFDHFKNGKVPSDVPATNRMRRRIRGNGQRQRESKKAGNRDHPHLTCQEQEWPESILGGRCTAALRRVHRHGVFQTVGEQAAEKMISCIVKNALACQTPQPAVIGQTINHVIDRNNNSP